MILKEFNNGWGDDLELRHFEKQIIARYLRSWYDDGHNNILINSTWYNRDYHLQVREYIQHNQVDNIALIACMDPPIPRSSWFDDLDVPIRSVGYYRGDDEIDIWALIMDRYFQLPHIDNGNFTIPFLSYNRKPHPHRRQLVERIEAAGCLHQGIVTLGDASGHARMKLEQDVPGSLLAPNAGPEQYGIANDIMSLGPMDIWNSCFLNVVTETVFDVDGEWFVSEKIYKPILGQRPFLVYAPNGAESWLQHIGMESFVDDFTDISDHDLRIPHTIPIFLAQLSDQGQPYLQKKYQQLLPKIKHNLWAFDAHVRAIQSRLDH